MKSTPSAWTKAATATVVSSGTGLPSSFTVTPNLTLAANTLTGFYVTTTGSGYLNYTNGSNTYSNSFLQLSLGEGIAYPFGAIFSTRTWNGNIHYTVQSGLGVPDVDKYTLNLQGGHSVDIVLAGQQGVHFTGEKLQLLGTDGSTVLATGSTTPTGGATVTNYDLGILNFLVPASGDYTVCLTSSATQGNYAIVVTDSLAFDTHPNSSFATAQSISGTNGVLGYVSPGSSGGTVTLTAVDTGWWDSTGAHTSTNKNYFAGYEPGTSGQVNDYFVFNLASVSQTIASARLSLYNPSNGYESSNSTETYTNYDVSTPISALEASGSGQTAIFNDLGSGNVLATTTVSAADDGTDVLVNMNSAGVSYLNAARGSQVAVGGVFTPIVGTAEQCIFGNSGTTSLNTLVLTYASTPASDWYSVNVAAAGAPLVLRTSTPADGPGEFENSLSPHIQLYDPSGNLVASGTVGTDGRNETINYTALVAGAYRIQVSAKSGTMGEYVLNLATPLTLTVPANETEGAGTVNGTVSVPTAPASNLTVSLVSSDPSRLTVPATVTIHAGQTSASVPITIDQHRLLNGPEAVIITAAGPGCDGATGTVEVPTALDGHAGRNAARQRPGERRHGDRHGNVQRRAVAERHRAIDLQRHDPPDRAGHGHAAGRADERELHGDAPGRPRDRVEPDAGHGDRVDGQLDQRRGHDRHFGRGRHDGAFAAGLRLERADAFRHGADRRHADHVPGGLPGIQQHDGTDAAGERDHPCRIDVGDLHGDAGR